MIKTKIKKWLGIDIVESRIETIENLILNEEAKANGFAVLKKHLNRPDKLLPNFRGKPIEQD